MNTMNTMNTMKSTYEQLNKIPGVPCLYRHENGTYFARKKFKGQTSPKLKTLNTANRKLAEIRLDEWIKQNEPLNGKEITLEQICNEFKETRKNRAEGTRENYDWVIDKLKAEFPFYRKSIFEIPDLEYAKYLSGLGLKTNGFVGVLKSILDIAVAAEYLKENPLSALKRKGVKVRVKVNRKRPTIPSEAQADAIIANMINKADDNGPKSSKDFLNFLYLAGIGEAELRKIDWIDFDWTEKKINLDRIKTNKGFYIPFFGWLEPFLIDLHNRRGNPKRGKVFELVSIKQGIWNTCKRLNYPKFSPRNFRQACIIRLIRSRVPVALIAKFQCHSDNGRLIQTTYSNVISETDSDYEKEMLNRTKA